MPDENEQNQDSTGEELEQVMARVSELEGLVAQKDEEQAKANTRISEMEGMTVESGLKLAEAVASYRGLVVKANPGVLDEMITGDNIEDINASLEKAKTLVSLVKQGFEAEMASVRIPAGAPERAPIDLGALTPLEKIQYAIGGKR